MTATDDLIDRLASVATPVVCLRPPLVRAAGWLALGLAMIAVLALLFGVRPDWNARIREPVFLLGMLASLVTGALAAVAAFLVSLPDRSRRWSLLPVPAACVWVSTIGLGCLTAWVPLDGTAMAPHDVLQCFAILLLSSVPLSALMFWMLRHAVGLCPRGAVLSASVAVAALTATALSVVHRFDASILILAWNLGAAGLVLAIDAAVGRAVMRRSIP